MLRILKYLPRILKDTFQYNYHRWIGKCDFPVSILPKFNYVSVIDIQSLLNGQTVYVLRRSLKSFNDTFNDLGKLREDAVTTKEIPFLSLNLLGGLFKPEHTRIRVLNNGVNRWKNNDFISIIDFLNDFTHIDNYSIVYIEANGVDGQTIPYTQTENKDLTKEINRFFEYIDKPIISDGSYTLEGVTKLLHDPINLNYWHLELNILDFKRNPIKHRSSRYIEDICKKILTDIICANSFSNVKDIPEIPKNIYKMSIFN
jgi:hypothetical protein